MRRISILLTALCAALLMPHLGSTQRVVTPGEQDEQLQLPVVAPITLSTLAASLTTVPPGQLDNLIGIDYQENSDSVIVSVHSTSGLPNNFVKVSRAGVVTQFSTASGFPEEVYFAIAPSQDCSGKGLSLGGFTVGDVFAGAGLGTGAGSTIARISADGTTIQNPFATLPGETGLLWGGLYFDRTGNFGGDLMVLTTTGGVYRVTSAGGVTLVARDPQKRAFEHIITLPNDSRFGPLSGKILIGGTDIGLPPSGKTNVYTVDPIGTFTAFPVPAIIEPEGFRIVPAGGDFFGTDFGGSVSGPWSVVTAPASGFSGIVGDLLIASEGDINPLSKTSHLFDVVWDPVNNVLKATLIPGGDVFQYEGITMSCLCAPATLTCPASVCAPSSTGGSGAVSYATPSTSKGTLATCVPPSGSVFAIGTTPVTCTADNGCSGTVSCGFNVNLTLFSLKIVDFAGSGSTLTINTTTGAYVFTCGDGTTMSGIAKLTVKGGIIVLEDNGGGKCVLARIDIASGRSVGTLQSPMGVVRCQINGRGFQSGCQF
jgi:hypothetical protein